MRLRVQREDAKLQKIRGEVEARLRQDIIIHGMVRFVSRADSVYHPEKFEGSCSLKPTVPLILCTLGVIKYTKTSSSTFRGTR